MGQITYCLKERRVLRRSQWLKSPRIKHGALAVSWLLVFNTKPAGTVISRRCASAEMSCRSPLHVHQSPGRTLGRTLLSRRLIQIREGDSRITGALTTVRFLLYVVFLQTPLSCHTTFRSRPSPLSYQLCHILCKRIRSRSLRNAQLAAVLLITTCLHTILPDLQIRPHHRVEDAVVARWPGTFRAQHPVPLLNEDETPG